MNSASIIFALIASLIFGALFNASHSRFGKRALRILLGVPIATLAYYMTFVSTTWQASWPGGYCCRSVRTAYSPLAS